jgi:hypothetical protein
LGPKLACMPIAVETTRHVRLLLPLARELQPPRFAEVFGPTIRTIRKVGVAYCLSIGTRVEHQ